MSSVSAQHCHEMLGIGHRVWKTATALGANGKYGGDSEVRAKEVRLGQPEP